MILLIPITALFLTWIWSDVFRMPERYKIFKYKPFNCPMCFAMWTALILYLCPAFITESLFVTSTAAALAAWMETKQ